jgi:hypothetical protein
VWVVACAEAQAPPVSGASKALKTLDGGTEAACPEGGVFAGGDASSSNDAPEPTAASSLQAEAAECGVAPLLDRNWQALSCSFGFCSVLGLRSDGTYRRTVLSSFGVTCELGLWSLQACRLQLQSDCGSAPVDCATCNCSGPGFSTSGCQEVSIESSDSVILNGVPYVEDSDGNSFFPCGVNECGVQLSLPL